MLKKLETKIYSILNENGKQSHLHDMVEYAICAIIGLNVILIVFESVLKQHGLGHVLSVFRTGFFIFFLVEYLLRVLIADMVTNDRQHPVSSRLKYIFSFWAIIDLLALLPVLLGNTIIDFRIFRVLRLLRVTQLKGLKDYTKILTLVLKRKGAQLLSALFIVLIFMLTSAVIVYDLEHKVQPAVFGNVLDGLWWAISAITTIGYGDMYPITPLGKILASCMSIFGVFLMAVPIGILTAGFFEVSKDMCAQKEEEEAEDIFD